MSNSADLSFVLQFGNLGTYTSFTSVCPTPLNSLLSGKITGEFHCWSARQTQKCFRFFTGMEARVRQTAIFNLHRNRNDRALKPSGAATIGPERFARLCVCSPAEPNGHWLAIAWIFPQRATLASQLFDVAIDAPLMKRRRGKCVPPALDRISVGRFASASFLGRGPCQCGEIGGRQRSPRQGLLSGKANLACTDELLIASRNSLVTGNLTGNF